MKVSENYLAFPNLEHVEILKSVSRSNDFPSWFHGRISAPLKANWTIVVFWVSLWNPTSHSWTKKNPRKKCDSLHTFPAENPTRKCPTTSTLKPPFFPTRKLAKLKILPSLPAPIRRSRYVFFYGMFFSRPLPLAAPKKLSRRAGAWTGKKKTSTRIGCVSMGVWEKKTRNFGRSLGHPLFL